MRRDLHDIRGRAGLSTGAGGEGETEAGLAPQTSKAIRRVLTALLCLAFLAGCAEFKKKPAYKRIPPAGKPPTQTVPQKPVPIPEAQRANVRPSTMDAVTPQRQASMKLVGRGRELLKEGDLERAASVLMDAVNVDSTNGVAYYYLAVANARQGNSEIADGLLDKAEALLGADEEWNAKIDELRAGLGAPPPEKVLTSPIDVSF